MPKVAAYLRGGWLAVVCACFLSYPAFAFGVQTSGCTLRPGLYQARLSLKQEYKRRVGRDASGPRRAIADRILGEEGEIDKQYYEFFFSLAKASLSRNEASFAQCLSLAEGDPIASPVAGLVAYLHGRRQHPGRFVASLPKDRRQLSTFFDLDDIAAGGTMESPSSLPGISMPDGLAEKITDELYALVLKSNSEATQEYLYLYQNSDGAYAEYVVNQLLGMLRDHPEVLLRQWRLVKPYSKRIAADLSSYSPEDWRKGVESLRNACRKHAYQSCAKALQIFH